MTTDQSQAVDVNDVLASIDEVLAEVAPVPAAAPSGDPATGISVMSGATDLTSSGPTPTTTAPQPQATTTPTAPLATTAQASGEEPRNTWWSDLYQHQDADLDTNTGRLPNNHAGQAARPQAAPAQAPVAEPVELAKPAAAAGAASEDPEPDTEQPGDREEEPGSGRIAGLGQLLVQSVKAPPGEESSPRWRLILYNGTAAGVGWGVGMSGAFERAITAAPQYVVPVDGVTLVIGLTSAVLGGRGGVKVLLSSIVVVGLLNTFPPTWTVAVGIPMVLWPVDARLRVWLQKADPTSKVWKAVAWMLRIPLATAFTVLALHGTN
ncbi:hypothetical protein [Streptacidiphilus sp. EB103A]|uniref:hypothetical protein n=1 Tax=Streptacidiphilus sp. EB103A TaxID=3156275 RepID=UPI0035127AAA